MRAFPSRSSVLLAATLAACAGRTPAPPYDRRLGLETFEAAWRIVHETHFDTTFNGVNWLAVREELRPRAERARTAEQLRLVVLDMVLRLGQSHFTLIPRELSDTLDPSQGQVVQGTVGMDVRLLDGELVVTRVDAGGSAERAGIRPGWVLLAVGTDTVAQVLERLRHRPSRYTLDVRAWSLAARRLTGSVDSAETFALRDAADRAVSARLTYLPERSEPVKLGNLPTFFARFEDQALGAGDRRIGLLRFNAWMAPLMRRLDDAVDRYRDLDGIVVDLRGNTGGVGAMLAGVAGHFLDRRDTLGTMRYRGGTMVFAANPRRSTPDGRTVRPFAGPVAVLVDELSASASEVFAGGMQSLGRVRVFGRTSMGAVLAARFDRLPNGDVLYHSFADFVTHDGTRLEGRGVIPDEPVALTRADLIAGRDAVLDAALRWIAAQPGGEHP